MATPSSKVNARSTLRDLARKLTFVPAGHEYREWQDPRSPTHLMYVYFDPAKLQIPADAGTADAFAAKLFFEDATLLDTALKLKRSLESPTSENQLYLEALGVVLAHELIRFNHRTPRSKPQLRGGLAAWQQRIVTEHIDAHLDETISLAALAQLARLSPYYFCRAFKQSFGVPPHRYHTSRRIEHAKSPACNARAFGDRHRIDCRLQRDELVHGGLSKGDRAYAERLSAESRLDQAIDRDRAGNGNRIAARLDQNGRVRPRASVGSNP